MALDERDRLVIGPLTIDPVSGGIIVVSEHGKEVFAFDAEKIRDRRLAEAGGRRGSTTSR